jgi:hypothetical protein
VTARARAAGAALVAAIAIAQTIAMGGAIAALDAALAISLALWLGTAWRADAPRLVPIYLAGVALMIAHVAEEYATDFPRRFPAVLGAEPWPSRLYLAFNGAWIVAMLAAAAGVRRRAPVAYVVVFFFAIGGGVGNGVGHVLLAVDAGGYFPGLATAPLLFAAGVLVLRALYRRPRGAS